MSDVKVKARSKYLIILISIISWLFILFLDNSVRGYFLSYTIIMHIFLAFCLSFKIDNDKVRYNVGQIYFFEVLLMLFWYLNIFHLGRIDDKRIVAIEILGGIVLALIVMQHSVILLNKEFVIAVKDYLKNNWGIILVSLLFILGSIPTFYSLSSNDSTIYYQGIEIAKNQWKFHNYSAYNLGAHSGYAYCFFLVIGDIIVNKFGIGGIIVNIILGVTAILAINGIVCRTTTKISHLERMLICSVFAFSPYLFGLVGEINLEYPQLCFLTWLIYAKISNKRLLQLISGLCLAFTKETGVLIFAGFYLGTFFVEMIKNKKTLMERILGAIKSNFKFAIITGLVWIYFFICLSSTLYSFSSNKNSPNLDYVSGYKMDSLGVWPGFIMYKILELFVFNWNWIIWVIIFALFFIRLKKGKNENVNYDTDVKGAIGGALFMFMFTQLFFVTWTNFRYQIPFLIFEILILVYSLYSTLSRKNLRIIILCVISTFVIISDFFSIDPISNCLFTKREYGNGELYYLTYFNLDCLKESNDGLKVTRCYDPKIDANEGKGGRDLSTYNRQRGYIGQVMKEFLEKIEYTKNDVIVIPSYLNTFEDTSNFLFCRDMYVWDNFIYWDSEYNMIRINNYRETNTNFDDSKNKLNIKFVDKIDTYDDFLNNYNRVFVLDISNLSNNESEFALSLSSQYEIKTYESKKNSICYRFMQLKKLL